MKFSISSLYTWYRDLLRNPKYRLWIVAGTLLYLISPFDVSPDVFPILGQIDDGIILTLFLTEVSSMVIESFKARRENTKGENSPANSTSEKDTIDVDAVSVE
ncbi:YkvA family protein [Calothrix sp. NIES-3974]|uniref:YkvA family protein n=1 Tax=Calothrix sp. NIES-3974 TaxID=2005462 RepID=UPI000B610653|nr:YkvA family protein [Calothrix sp. NIES-3974]BAZ05847.1 hypothetical protein NIES3974_25020 [Calothrix sp. NIES-3974]